MFLSDRRHPTHPYLKIKNQLEGKLLTMVQPYIYDFTFT